MKYTTLATIAAAVGAVSAADNDKGVVIGSWVFSRHGDRNAKPTKYLTPKGVYEEQDAGDAVRERYMNSDSDFKIDGLNSTYQEEQLFSAVPNSDVLQKSHKAFLQALFPPVKKANIDTDTVQGSSLVNGSSEVNPLDGYQYVYSKGIESTSPDSIWIQGSSNCPKCENASDAYLDSKEFKDMNKSTHDWYQGLYDKLDGGVPKSKLNYGNAYTVFDYITVNSYHNGTFWDNFKKNDDHQQIADQVRYYSDLYSMKVNYNESNSDTYIGGKTLAGSMLDALNKTKVDGNPKLTHFTGSYSTFYQLWGALDMYKQDESKYAGLVNFAATAVAELVKKDNDYYVRFAFRNGTGDASFENLKVLDFKDDLVPYDDFVKKVGDRSIRDMESWCKQCGGFDNDMCVQYSPKFKKAKADGFDIKDASKNSGSNLSLADAGGIGAGVTIGVAAILGGLAYLLFGRKKKAAAAAPQDVEKQNGQLTKEVTPSSDGTRNDN